jgi:hypothetical protein
VRSKNNMNKSTKSEDENALMIAMMHWRRQKGKNGDEEWG